MINFSPNSNHDRYNCALEITSSDASDRVKPIPRHILPLESKAHSSRDRLARADNLSKLYSGNSNFNNTQATELAVNISQYQLGDRVLLQKHSENVRSNLEHRLQVARRRENAQLVTLLLAELKQLQTNT